MRKINEQLAKLRRTPGGGVTINGERYVCYEHFMWLMQLSDHPNQLERKQEKYPAHFITVNDKPYVTERYARYILHCQYAQKQREALGQAACKKEANYGNV